MGNKQSSVKKVNFEDIQFLLKNNLNHSLLINTLNANEQDCLIKGTVNINKEESIINANLNKYNLKIIIYDKNSSQEHLYKKYHQLINLGFKDVYVYLVDYLNGYAYKIYTDKILFPTTKPELDILKYKPRSLLTNNYLLNID